MQVDLLGIIIDEQRTPYPVHIYIFIQTFFKLQKITKLINEFLQLSRGYFSC